MKQSNSIRLFRLKFNVLCMSFALYHISFCELVRFIYQYFSMLLYLPQGNRTISNISALRWRHNERDGVSNHQRLDCLLSRLFRRRSKKTSKLRVTGLCEENSLGDQWIPRTNGQWRRTWVHLMTSSWVKQSWRTCPISPQKKTQQGIIHVHNPSDIPFTCCVGLRQKETIFYLNLNGIYNFRHIYLIIRRTWSAIFAPAKFGICICICICICVYVYVHVYVYMYM